MSSTDNGGAACPAELRDRRSFARQFVLNRAAARRDQMSGKAAAEEAMNAWNQIERLAERSKDD